MAINQHSGFVFSEEVDISELEDVFEDLALLQVSETFEQDQKFDPQYDEELSRICDQVGSGVLKRINSGEINNVSAKRVRLEEPTTSRGSAAAEQSSTLHGNLEKLTKNLKDDEFHELGLHFPNQNDFDRLRQKGVFPYEYMTSLECFDLTFLPNKKHFRSSLTNNDISDADYNRALDVWQHFGCENMLDYSNLYLKTDVLLLTDVFENFRRLCIKTYGLDPAHYYTAPGLSWDAMLKKTNVKLELLTDIDQIAFIKAGIRGGISQCSNRYAKSNNKYLEDFDKNIPSSYIIYLDANNLYGWAMSQYLPEGGFKWVSLDTNFNIPDTSEYGYILEVDLEYSQDLHDKHSDFPMCPENVNIDYPEMSVSLTHGSVRSIVFRKLSIDGADINTSRIDARWHRATFLRGGPPANPLRSRFETPASQGGGPPAIPRRSRFETPASQGGVPQRRVPTSEPELSNPNYLY
ncbi:unnamed protein product [Leptosia nina]|uniref:DNA-directed DNA polymerase n=1 Tax=Leptosia nina TaxID=320188 RepID=A0AAV1J6X7_9NEOP